MHGEMKGRERIPFVLKPAAGSSIRIAALDGLRRVGPEWVQQLQQHLDQKPTTTTRKKEQVNDKKNATQNGAERSGYDEGRRFGGVRSSRTLVSRGNGDGGEASETVVAGAVISQSVKAKSESEAAGSSIGITVSKGSDKPAKRCRCPA